jgi:tetratricopeptide (TPR) repeat protein
MRLLHRLGIVHLGFLAIVGGADWVLARPAPAPAPRQSTVARASSGQAWFRRIKPYCNQVEAAVAIQRDPAPSDRDGQAYAAACYALAGRIDQADRVLMGIEDADERHRAAGVVFQVGHPVADAGDDDSAGPIMRLVVKHQPSNYMALYHAGIAEFNMGDTQLAREHLVRFLDLYGRDDGWRKNGRRVLAMIENQEREPVFSGHGRIP